MLKGWTTSSGDGLTVLPLVATIVALPSLISLTSPSIHAASGSSSHTCDPTMMFTGVPCPRNKNQATPSTTTITWTTSHHRLIGMIARKAELTRSKLTIWPVQSIDGWTQLDRRRDELLLRMQTWGLTREPCTTGRSYGLLQMRTRTTGKEKAEAEHAMWCDGKRKGKQREGGREEGRKGIYKLVGRSGVAVAGCELVRAPLLVGKSRNCYGHPKALPTLAAAMFSSLVWCACYTHYSYGLYKLVQNDR